MKFIFSIIILVFTFYYSVAQEYEYLAPVKYNGKWGVIDIEGNWKVEPILDFEKILPFGEDGYAGFKYDKKWGFIDT